jgi:kinetochore protein NNF1
MKDRNVVSLLNSLDRLIHEARHRKQTAEADGAEVDVPITPHTLPPCDLVNAHLASFLTDQHAVIKAQTSEIEAKNVQLMDTIKQQRQEMESLVMGLEHVVADLERSAAMLQGDDVQSLTAEVKMVEDELKT